MELTRLVFLAVNHTYFNLTWQSFALISRGGLIFDTSAILYVNSLWLALVFFPLHYKERSGFRLFEKIVFTATNAIALGANLCDAVFFQYRRHRSTMALFDEFGHEGPLSMLKIVSTEALGHWYLVLLFAAMVWFLWHFYRPASLSFSGKPLWRYYLIQTLCLAFSVVIFIWGVRGCTLSKVTRPITVGYAQRFATEPIDVDLALNTPFAMIRTINNSLDPVPQFFSDSELLEIYSPVHVPNDTVGGQLRGHNVIFLVLESFGQSFIGSLNPYQGYTPFLDSLLCHSLRFEETYSNCGFSIDALPALIASTPRMNHSFVVSPYSLNRVSGIGTLLGDEGYHTAFFHGADNESLGLQAFVRQAGFKNYYGINEYVADPQTGGMDDFDGTWGIYDGPMLQYFCRKIGEMPQPFVAGLFTLTTHHPFDLPQEYQDVYPPEGSSGIYRTLRYTDNALREFFNKAKTQDWFENTLFVISADHAFLSRLEHEEYNTEYGCMLIPIALYDPSGTLQAGVRPGVMQQIDVLPTVLTLLGYDKPYFAFGQDVLNIPADSTWAFRWNHFPQITDGKYFLQLKSDDWKPFGLFDIRTDSLLQNNLLGQYPELEETMQRKLSYFRQAPDELYQDPPRRQGDGADVAVRPDPGQDHLEK